MPSLAESHQLQGSDSSIACRPRAQSPRQSWKMSTWRHQTGCLTLRSVKSTTASRASICQGIWRNCATYLYTATSGHVDVTAHGSMSIYSIIGPSFPAGCAKRLVADYCNLRIRIWSMVRHACQRVRHTWPACTGELPASGRTFRRQADLEVHILCGRPLIA